jgi:glycosyltransferase involved in cell wall biosynthesis
MSEGRVLQLLGPSTGGIRRVVAGLTTSLRQRGWDVVTAGPEGVLAGLIGQDAVVPVPGGLSPLALLRARRSLTQLLAGVDIVHAHGLKPGWLVASVRRHPPLVTSVHNLVLDESAGATAPVLRALEGRIPRISQRVIALSPGIADRYRGAPGVVVIPPTADAPRPSRSVQEVRAAYGVGPGDRLVVAAARLHPQKDLTMLLGAIDHVRRRVEDVRLVVVGEGPEEAALRKRIVELGLADIVTLAGGRPSAADELAAADVVAISSRWESGPLVLFEAMQLGRPVVTTDVGAAPEVVTDGENGRLVPAGNADAFADALIDLLSDRSRADALGEAGRLAVIARHGPDAMASATESVYRELLR